MINDYTDFRRQPIAVGPDVAPMPAPQSLDFTPPPKKESSAGGFGSGMASAIMAGAAAGSAARRGAFQAKETDAPLRVPKRPGLGGTPSQRIALDESVVGGVT